jgi:hypothetical protein
MKKRNLVKIRIKKNREKLFEKVTGVRYALRVANLNSGETEW